jgi:hypothetical protein
MISPLPRHRINSFSHSPIRIKLNMHKLPTDFFKKTCHYRVNSYEIRNTKIGHNPATPMFGKRKNILGVMERKVLSALENYSSEEED